MGSFNGEVYNIDYDNNKYIPLNIGLVDPFFTLE